METKIPLIMVVEDNPLSKKIMSECVFKNIKCLYASNIKQAIYLFDRERPAIIFLDIELPDGNGLDLLKNFKEKESNIFVVIVSSRNDSETVMTAIKEGARGYCCKPLTKERLEFYLKKYNKETFLDELF